MNARTETQNNIESLSRQWKQEHVELGGFFDEYRRWAYEISQRGIPHFGETACKLKDMRKRLVKHFAREDEICEQLSLLISMPSPEVEANRRQVASDHVDLLARLDQLTDQLQEIDPPFDSWQQAVEAVELFCDALEQHEEQEADCLEWLIPKETGGERAPPK